MCNKSTDNYSIVSLIIITMRKLLRNVALLLLMALTPSLLMAQEQPQAQQMPQIPQLPADANVHIGKLSNGLTYYIRHNNYPKGQADFYIAQKVGSILENDDQRGLAHFLEHMCFNGTTHFPGKNLINYLESVGVKFGYNLNAYTSVDQTVYNISNVPVTRVGVQDSCLLILHDWANDLLLLPEEIDAERGVIHEEWRRSMVGQMRILEKLLPVIYPNSPYGYRLPIGTMDVVDNFKPKALRDYYEKWYRPDLQGIIVVGDIDVDRIESKIKEMFADIEMPANPAERVYFPVDDTKGTIYAIGHDKEMSRNIADLMIKMDVMPRQLRNTALHYQQAYFDFMVRHMMASRFDEITSKPDAPFASASVSRDNFFLAKTKDCLDLEVLAKNTEELPSSIAAAYRELLRASRNGFNPSEYERAKAEYLSQFEKAYNNRENTESNKYVQEYVSNFLDDTPIPGIENEYEIAKQLSSVITLDFINQYMKQIVTADNRVLMVMMPDNAENKYPGEEAFKTALEAVDGETIEAKKEETKNEPLIPSLRKPGKVVKSEYLKDWDALQYTLSNGVKVIVKTTEFKKDEIRMRASALNGWSALKSKTPANVISFPLFGRSYGLGTYSRSDIDKYLAGKQVSVNPSLDCYTRDITGNSTPKDLPTMMELIYALFTEFNFTPDEFAALQNTYSSVLKNQASNPTYQVQKFYYESTYKSPYQQIVSEDIVNAATREGIIKMMSEATANAADYTFVFAGNIDLATFRPLMEKYIGSLPAKADKKPAAVKYDNAYNPVSGTVTDELTIPMETPQTWALITESGNMEYTSKDAKIASIIGQVLSNRLLNKVREEMGAVYSIGAMGSMERIDVPNTNILTQFPMKPEMKDEVLNVIAAEFKSMGENVTEEEINKAKEYMVKNYKADLEKNGSWISAITGTRLNGVNNWEDYINVITGITVDDVKAFANKLHDQGNYHVVIVDPEAKK